MSHRRLPRFVFTALAALALLTAGSGCSAEASSPRSSGDDGTEHQTSSGGSGPAEHLPPAVGTDGVVWRGPVSWRTPDHWTSIDASSRPFLAAEYSLPGDAPQSPSRCRVRNGSASKNRSADELREVAVRLARRSDLKTADLESLRRQVEIEDVDERDVTWIVGTVEGSYVDDGTVLEPRDPALVVSDYASWSAVPLLPGPPLSIRCSAPRRVMKGERKHLERWLASIAITTP